MTHQKTTYRNSVPGPEGGNLFEVILCGIKWDHQMSGIGITELKILINEG